MYRGKVLLLGTVQVLTAQEEALEAVSPRLQALCVYLALHQGEPVDRRRLAFLIWPNVPEPAARRNLRQYLHRLRGYLKPLDPEGTLLIADGATVVFDPERRLWVDVRAFRELVERAEQSEGPAQVAALRQAVELYQGDLAPAVYDEWCHIEREHLRLQYERALHRLIAAYEAAQRWDEAIYWAERALRSDPLQEALYRKLMVFYARLGDRAQAIAAYERCCRVLQDELGVEPLPETTQLYNELLAGQPIASSKTFPQSELPKVHASSTLRASSSETSTLPEARPGLGARWVPPLIGRDEDLRWLDRILSRAARQGAFVLIEGEAGVGKTRLVSEWISRLPPAFRVLSVEGSEFGHIIPYYTLKMLLEEHADKLLWNALPYRERWQEAVRYLLPTWEKASAPPLMSSAPVDHWLLMEGIAWLFQALAEQSPTVVWVDDAHWADQPSWQTLAYLGQRLVRHFPLYLVLSLRPEDLGKPLQRIRRRLIEAELVHVRSLAPLSRKDTYVLVQAVLGPHLDPEVLKRLYALTEGNPLFVIEMARTLRSQPTPRWLLRLSHPSELPLPQRVRHIVESRLDTLSAEARELLQVASVIGRHFTVSLLCELAEAEESSVLRALDEWLDKGLVHEIEGGYAFTHALIWQGVYNELSTARRRWLHRRLAERLEKEGNVPAALVARHYAASDRAHNALPFLMSAADEALRARSYEEAKACALEVLRIWKQAPLSQLDKETTRVDVNLQLARAYTLSGILEDALVLLEETRAVAERLADPSRLAQVYLRMAQALWHRGDPRAAQDQARAALRWAELARDTSLRAAALRMVGRTAIVLSAFDDAIMALREHLDAVPPEDPRQVSVWSYLAVAWARVGHWPQAFDCAQRAVALAERLPGPTNRALAYLHHSFVWLERRHWGQAEQWAQKALEHLDEDLFTPVYFMAKAVQAYALGMLGHRQEAISALEMIIRRAEAERHRVLVHLPYYFLAHVHFHHQIYTDALQVVRQALDLAQQAGDRWATAVALRLEAEILGALPYPDWRSIEEKLVRSADILRQVRARPDLARTYLSLRRLYDRAARMAWAVDCHFRAVALFEEMGMVEELRAAQGQARRPARPAPSALTAPLAGPSWIREQAGQAPRRDQVSS